MTGYDRGDTSEATDRTGEERRLAGHLDAVLTRTRRWSRTAATGHVDTSTSAAKAAALAEVSARSRDSSPDRHDQPRRQVAAVEDAVRAACLLLDAHSFVHLDSSLLLTLNGAVAGTGLGGRVRAHEKPEFGYLPSDQISGDMEAFCARARTWPTTTATRDEIVDLLFDVHWSVDLRGHYFLDGCGRTALILGCWVSVSLCGALLEMPDRDAYLAIAADPDPKAQWLRLMSAKP